MSGAMPPMALEQAGRAVQEKRKENAVGLGEIERAFQSTPGGASVAERVTCDRLKQENLNQPAAGFVTGAESSRAGASVSVAACGSSWASRSAARTVRISSVPRWC